MAGLGRQGSIETAMHVSRQMLEDTKFKQAQRNKLQLIEGMDQHEIPFSNWFTTAILVNMVLIGVETEMSINPVTEREFRTFWDWVESFFIVIFAVEFYLRSKCLVEAEREYKERRAEYDERSRAALAPEWKKPAGRGTLGGSLAGLAGKKIAQAMRKPRLFRPAGESSETLGGRIKPTRSLDIHFWLIFDLAILVVSITDVWVVGLAAGGDDLAAGSSLQSLRILRIVRVLRSVKLLRYVKDLWLLMNGCVMAFRTLGWIIFLLFMFTYVCALFAAKLMGESAACVDALKVDPLSAQSLGCRNFEGLATSMLTLFKVMTLEEWPDIAAKSQAKSQLWVMCFFLLYILVSHMMILNLFVAVIVEHTRASSTTHDIEFMRELKDKQTETLHLLEELFRTADLDGSGTLSTEEFNQALDDNGEANQALDRLQIKRHEVDSLFGVLDVDGDNELSVDEFMEGMMSLKAAEISRNLFRLQYAVLRELKKLESTARVAEATGGRLGRSQTKAKLAMDLTEEAAEWMHHVKSTAESLRVESRSFANLQTALPSRSCAVAQRRLDEVNAAWQRVLEGLEGTIPQNRSDMQPLLKAVGPSLSSVTSIGADGNGHSLEAESVPGSPSPPSSIPAAIAEDAEDAT